MQFLEGTLQVTQPDEALAVNVPAANMRDFTVERECVRRCFWLVQVMFFINGIYTYRPLRPRTVELVRKVRLPVDENSFELARITSQPGEQICPPRCRRPVPPHFPINEFADATIATRQSSLPSLARFYGRGRTEYLHTPAPQNKYASQFGHVCRVLSLYHSLQSAIGEWPWPRRLCA